MAIPMVIENEAITYNDSEVYYMLSMLFVAAVSASIYCFYFGDPFDEDDQETLKTPPTKNKRRAGEEPECPGAPIVKRRRPDVFFEMEPRQLFPTTPETTTDEERECPGAPVKTRKKKTMRRKRSVTTKLDFDNVESSDMEAMVTFKTLADYETEVKEISSETQFLCSIYKPNTDITQLLIDLHNEADTLDYTNPDRQSFKLNPPSIINYILSINRIIKSIEYLNSIDYALPHSGNGKLTARNKGTYYLLIDKLFNVMVTVSQLNKGLSDRLNDIFEKCSHKWDIVPESYAQACKLNCEAKILQKQLYNEVTTNMNKTEWAEW
jgi:hypothetical protein